MGLRSVREAQERLRTSEARLLQEYATLAQAASSGRLEPDPPAVCPACQGQAPARATRCSRCGHDFSASAAGGALGEGDSLMWLRRWSRVIAMFVLIFLGLLDAPGSIVAALAASVVCLPELASLAILPASLLMLPVAHLYGPAMVLGILALVAWCVAARVLQRSMLHPLPVAAAAASAGAIALLAAALFASGWIEYPAWCARSRPQATDREAVERALDAALPDSSALERVQVPGCPWRFGARQPEVSVLYDLRFDAEESPHILASVVPIGRSVSTEVPASEALVERLDAFATSAEAPGGGPSLSVLRNDEDMLLALDDTSSPTLHLYLAILPRPREAPIPLNSEEEKEVEPE